MPTPSSGTISMFDINSAFNRGNDLNAYRGTVWYVPNSLTTGTFPSGQIAFSDFYNKTGTNPVVPSPVGGIAYTTPGTYSFTVPLFRTSLTILLWAGGGGGGCYGDSSGSSYASGNVYGNTGGTSSFNGDMIALGGSGGQTAGTSRYGGLAVGAGGAGGTASGGDVNTSGSNGTAGDAGCIGGASPNGGTATAFLSFTSGGYAGNYQGGGGGGAYYSSGGKFPARSGGGGGGAYLSKTYTPSQLAAGTTVVLIIGAGGNGALFNLAGGNGANGKAIISWT